MEARMTKIEFQAVRNIYPLNESLYCYFTIPNTLSCKPETGDWVGIYTVGWKSLKEVVCKKMIRIEDIWGKQEQEQYGQVVFEAEQLPKETEHYYQFVYVKGETIKGASKPFSFEEFEVIERQDVLGRPQLQRENIEQVFGGIRGQQQKMHQQHQQQQQERFLQRGIEQVLGQSLEELEHDLKQQKQQQQLKQQQQQRYAQPTYPVELPTERVHYAQQQPLQWKLQQEQQQQPEWRVQEQLAGEYVRPVQQTIYEQTVEGAKWQLPRVAQEVEQRITEQYLVEQQQRTREQNRMYYQLKTVERMIEERQRREVEIQEQEARKVERLVEEFRQRLQPLVKETTTLGQFEIQQEQQQKVHQYVRRYESLLRQKIRCEAERRQQVFQTLIQTIKKCEQHLRELQQNEVQYTAYFVRQLNEKLRTMHEQQQLKHIELLNGEKREQEIKRQLRVFQQTFFEQRRPQQEILRRTHKLLKQMVEEVLVQFGQVELRGNGQCQGQLETFEQQTAEFRPQVRFAMDGVFGWQNMLTGEWIRQIVRKLKDLEQGLRQECFELYGVECQETPLRLRTVEKNLEKLNKMIRMFEQLIAQPEEIRSIRTILHQLFDLEGELTGCQFYFGSYKQHQLRLNLIAMIREKILAILPIIEQQQQIGAQRILAELFGERFGEQYKPGQQLRREYTQKVAVQFERFLELVNGIEMQLVEHQRLVRHVRPTEVTILRQDETELRRQLLNKIREVKYEQPILCKKVYKMIQEIQTLYPEQTELRQQLVQQCQYTEQLIQKLVELEQTLTEQQFDQYTIQYETRLLQQIKDLHTQMQIVCRKWLVQEEINNNMTTMFGEWTLEEPEMIIGENTNKDLWTMPEEEYIRRYEQLQHEGQWNQTIKARIEEVLRLRRQYEELRKIKSQLEVRLMPVEQRWEQTEQLGQYYETKVGGAERRAYEPTIFFPVECEITFAAEPEKKGLRYIKNVEQVLSQLEEEVERMRLQTVRPLGQFYGQQQQQQVPRSQTMSVLEGRQQYQPELRIYSVQPRQVRMSQLESEILNGQLENINMPEFELQINGHIYN